MVAKYLILGDKYTINKKMGYNKFKLSNSLYKINAGKNGLWGRAHTPQIPFPNYHNEHMG